MENYHEHIKMTKMRTASGKEKRGAIEVGIAISDVDMFYSGKISHC